MQETLKKVEVSLSENYGKEQENEGQESDNKKASKKEIVSNLGKIKSSFANNIPKNSMYSITQYNTCDTVTWWLVVSALAWRWEGPGSYPDCVDFAYLGFLRALRFNPTVQQHAHKLIEDSKLPLSVNTNECVAL